MHLGMPGISLPNLRIKVLKLNKIAGMNGSELLYIMPQQHKYFFYGVRCPLLNQGILLFLFFQVKINSLPYKIFFIPKIHKKIVFG